MEARPAASRHVGHEPGEAAAPPVSRLDAALSKAWTLDLEALPRPVRRGTREASHRLLLDGRVLGELAETSRGYLAYDDGRAVWVGPFKRLSDAARVFLAPATPAPQARPVIGIPTTKGRAFWSMRVDLVPRAEDAKKTRK